MSKGLKIIWFIVITILIALYCFMNMPLANTIISTIVLELLLINIYGFSKEKNNE